MFNAKEQKDKVVQWIKNWFEENGKGCNAVIGISGGKDSSVVAGLCVEALGVNRVIGVLMPNGDQPDIEDSYLLCSTLGIKHYVINIGNTENAILDEMDKAGIKISSQTLINLPARLRMCALYAVSQSANGRVSNNCNYSENYVGYSTIFGDAAGDFSPLKSFTTEEVVAIGKELGLPDQLVEKTPSDGLCGKSDEDNLGFTYAVLNKYIREGVIDDSDAKAQIDRLHNINAFKEKPMAGYTYEP